MSTLKTINVGITLAEYEQIANIARAGGTTVDRIILHFMRAGMHHVAERMRQADDGLNLRTDVGPPQEATG